MNVSINGDTKELPFDSITITDLLKHQAVKQPEMVTVQLNGNFVSKEELATTTIRDNDEVEFVYFMGGGR